MSVQGMKWAMAILVVMFYAFLPEVGKAQPFDVFVSISPQKYVVERIGGQLVHVSVMIPPGASPHVYEPKPAQMRTLSQANIYFAIGVEFEKALLPKLSALHPGLQIVRTDAGIEKMPMIPYHHHDHGQGHDHDEHDHGHAHGSDHGHDDHPQEGLDNHVWLAPELVRVQAGHILSALTELDAEHAPVYEANYSAFLQDLDALDAAIQQALEGNTGSAFMVFHPAWGYFARQYGLEQIPVEIEGKEPRAQDLQQLIDRAVEEEIRVVFVSPQFSTRSAEIIASAIKGRIVAIDPLAENWMDNMLTVAREFNEAFR